ncbi:MULTISPECIES: hypothetical protein [unclassified Bradyrhizobium]|jgi:hypothetical protein|nr:MULTISPECIES: hypothetical protein [unclassified Bradyrhizobium]
MLQNLLASIGILAIIVVTIARMTLQPRRLRLKQPARPGTLPPHRRRPF